MLIPSALRITAHLMASLSRRVNANSQQVQQMQLTPPKLIKKGEC